MHVYMAHFLKLIWGSRKNGPFECWIQLMIGGFKTVNLARVNKIIVIGYTWIFVYEVAHSYEEGMHVLPALKALEIII